MPSGPSFIVTSCTACSASTRFHVAAASMSNAVRLAGALPLIAPPFARTSSTACSMASTACSSPVRLRTCIRCIFGERARPRVAAGPRARCVDAAVDPQSAGRGIPLFAICRGAQEPSGPRRHGCIRPCTKHRACGWDHRAPRGGPARCIRPVAYGAKRFPAACWLRSVGGDASRLNSVHGQDQAAGRRPARRGARADGLSRRRPARRPGFNLCVQWHPEWKRLRTQCRNACSRFRRSGAPISRSRPCPPASLGHHRLTFVRRRHRAPHPFSEQQTQVPS